MAKQKKTEYGEQSIKSLKGAERVRLRPAVIFGSDDIIGAQHSFVEILANSVDEAREGYGDKKGWKILVKRAMESDNSWGKSANEYIKMYKEILKQ